MSNRNMTKKEHNELRLLEFIHAKKGLTRTKLTRRGLDRFRGHTLEDLNNIVNSLIDDGRLYFHYWYTGGRGRPIKMYTVTPKGLAWVKAKRREVKKMLRRIG